MLDCLERGSQGDMIGLSERISESEVRMKINGIFSAAILTAVLCISGNALAVLSGGGTQADPYLIQSRGDFDEFADPANSAIYWTSGVYTKLMCDLNLCDPNLSATYTQAVIAPDTNSVTTGFQGTKFSGIFDGNGHAISNMNINASTHDYIGLFGYVTSPSQICNLGVVGVNVAGRSYVGGLIGCKVGASLTNCYTTGSVSGNSSVGGLVGSDFLGTLTACFWDINTSGTSDGVGDVEPDPDGVTGKTTSEMMTLSTFILADWDFTDTDGDPADWQMPANSYPRLAWQIAGDIAGFYGVSAVDYAVIAAAWQATPSAPNWNPAADLNSDGVENFLDMLILSTNWLEGI
jgi:hypothetical protein